jgi:hypothetical protein
MGSIFGGYNKQESSNQSNSGFTGPTKDWASQDAYQGLTNLAATGKYLLHRDVPQFQFSQNLPGLFKEQEGWANAFASQLFNKTSGSAAARGQLTPFNTPAVVGSALTKAAPTILPLIGQNLQNSFLIPEQIQATRFQTAMSPLQALISGLGSSASGSSSGFGIQGGVSIGSGGGGGGGGSALFGSCWIAERFYGKTDIRTHILRAWFKARPDWWVSKLYRQYGEWASKQWWCPILRPVFDAFLAVAVAELERR